MTAKRKFMFNITSITHYIGLSKGKQILGGTVKLRPNLVLQHVFYVANPTYNLPSISQLWHFNHEYAEIFVKDSRVIHDFTSWKVIGMGKLIQGMYYFSQE